MRMPRDAVNAKAPPTGGRRAFEEIDHTADRAFHIFGSDLASLFVNAAKALFCAGPPPASSAASVHRDVQVDGADRESLLVNWLNELLYLQEAHRESYCDFRIAEASERRILARVRGSRQQSANRTIKAITFHNLEVRQESDGWHATVVVDV